MKVKHMIEILERFNPEMDVLFVQREESENILWDASEKISFRRTEFGTQQALIELE